MRHRGHIHSSINHGFPFEMSEFHLIPFCLKYGLCKRDNWLQITGKFKFPLANAYQWLADQKNFIWKRITRRKIATKKTDRTMRHRQCNFLFFYRVDWIRTSDLCVPNAALCQTELRPANPYPQIDEPVKDKNKPNPTTKFICLLTSENHPRI